MAISAHYCLLRMHRNIFTVYASTDTSIIKAFATNWRIEVWFSVERNFCFRWDIPSLRPIQRHIQWLPDQCRGQQWEETKDQNHLQAPKLVVRAALLGVETPGGKHVDIHIYSWGYPEKCYEFCNALQTALLAVQNYVILNTWYCLNFWW
jgi:hypothetical protein